MAEDSSSGILGFCRFRVTTVLPSSGSCRKTWVRAGDGGLSYLPAWLYFFDWVNLLIQGRYSETSVKSTSRHGATRTRFESSATPLPEPQNTAGYIRRNNAVRTASLIKSRINEPCFSGAHKSAMYRSLSAGRKSPRLKRTSYRQII